MPGTEGSTEARLVRVEERVDGIHTLLLEVRTDLKRVTSRLDQGFGGFKALSLIGGIAAALGALWSMLHYIGSLFPARGG